MHQDPRFRPSVDPTQFTEIDSRLIHSLRRLFEVDAPAAVSLHGALRLQFKATDRAGQDLGRGESEWLVHEINFTRTNRNDDVITISTKSRDLAQPFQLHRILTEESIPTELALRYNDGKPELIISNKSIDTIGTIRIMPNREQTELSPPGQTTLPLEAKPRLSETTTGPTTHRVIHIALNVIWRKDPTTQQLEYLLIQEAAGSRSAGLWYLPAGRVEENESPEQGAIREALEESGMVINLGEVLATESWRLGNILKMRHIFSATPRFDQEPKSHSDQHSMKAAWFRLDEIESLPLRGTEILDYLRKIHTRESKS